MPNLNNTYPIEQITKNDSWFPHLFSMCFNRENPWLQNLEDSKYQAFHITKHAFILTYTVQDCTDLLTIGVHPEQRKKGFALKLLKTAIDRAPDDQKFFLDVECQNTAAIQLYKKVGFELLSIRKGYYPQLHGPSLDALVMTYQKAD